MTELAESTVRSRAKHLGLAIRKSRRMLSLNNYGRYQVVDFNRNEIVAGERYDLTLGDIDFILWRMKDPTCCREAAEYIAGAVSGAVNDCC